jgi:DNA-binding transcriptional regulator YiaG
MNDQKIKFPEELTEAERLEFLNYLLQILQINSSQSRACVSSNDDRDSHPVDEKVDYNHILFPILSEITLTVLNTDNPKSARQLQTIFDDGADRLQKMIGRYADSPELETKLNKLFNSIEIKITKIITKDYPQLNNRVHQAPNFKNRLFENNKYQILPSVLPMKTSTLCQLRDDFWQQSHSDGIAYYRQESSHSSDNFIEHYISSRKDIQVLPWDSARQIIDKFGFNTVLLQLLLAAHAVKCDRPWDSQFSLSGTDIIRELGWDKRTDIPLHAKLLELANTAFALDCLLIKAVWEEPNQRKGKRSVTIDTSRMWNIQVRMIGQMDLAGKVDSPKELYITVRPGLWTQGFINSGNKNSQDALYQFGYLAQDVMKMNPYHNELALRLAIHLTLDSHAEQILEYRVRELLEIAIPKSKIELDCQDRDRKYKLKQQWDRAIAKLIELGWEIEFDKETYPEGIQPGSDVRNQHGYIERLLNAKIYIKSMFPQRGDVSCQLPNLLMPELPPPISSQPTVKPTPMQVPVAIEDIPNFNIRAARTAKKLTQRELAVTMGVSQSLVAQWERGAKSIDDKHLIKLKQILNIS